MTDNKPIVFHRCVAALILAIVAGCTGNTNTTDTSKSSTVGSTNTTTPAAPPAPSGLVATPGNAQATLNWSESSGATGYDIKRSHDGGASYAQIASGTSPSYTDATVTNGDTYFYVVAAVNSGGESGNSNDVSVTPDPTITTPAVPVDLVATAGDMQASLAWTSSTGATSYHVKRATNSGGPYTQIATPTSAAYTDSSLADGMTYYYVVSALNSAGESTNSAQVSAAPVAPTEIPPAPAGLTATPGNAQVNLSWSPSTGATGYHVKRSTNVGGPFTQVAAPTSANYSDFSVSNGTKYYYVVSALDSAGESGDSGQVSAVPAAPTAPVTIAAIPAGLSASPGNAQVTLSWSLSSSATSYNVKRATGSGGPYSKIGETNQRSYTDTAVTNGVSYYYVVSAVNSAGESANSTQVSAMPVAPASPASVPADVSASPGNALVSLNWSASNGATSYNVKRATTSGGPYTRIGTPSSTSYTDSSAVNGTTYYYVVSSVDSAGESANSSQVSAMPSAPASIAAVPANVSASPGNALVSLNWSASSGANSYNVKRATTSGGPYTQIGTTSSTSYTDSSAANGTAYYYVVSAVDSAGESANSAQVSATPVSPTPAPTASCTSAHSGAQLNVWENITPAAFAGYTPLSVAVDPQNQALFSAAGNHGGVTGTGIYKSTDCGATWKFLSGGINNDLTTGNVWSIGVVIDPNSPSGRSMYASGAYATASGGQALHKSTDGGVTWKILNSDPNNLLSLHTDFVQVFAVDPTNPLHIAVTFHDNCTSMVTANCMSETFDGGTTWTEFSGPPISSWSEGAGLAILPGPNGTTSLIHTDEQSYNVYYAVDTPGASKNWIQVITNVPFYSSMFDLAPDGTAYVGSLGGIYYSRATANTPLGRVWTLIPNSPSAATLIDDGVNLIATDIWSHTPSQPFQITPLATTTNPNGPAWTKMTGSPGGASSTMAFDPVNRIVYASNPLTGVWRYVEP